MRLLSGWPLWWRLLVIAGLWGSSFPLLRAMAPLMSPFALATVRGIAATLAVLLFLAATGALRPLSRTTLRHALVIGTLNGWVPSLLTTLALTRIESAPAALIQAATPLLVAIAAGLLMHEERAGRRAALGLLVGFAGVALIVGPAAFEGGASLVGGAMMLATSVSYATGTVYVRYVRAGDAAPLALGQQAVAAVVVGALSAGFDPPGAYDQPWEVWLGVVVLGVFGSAVPLTMFLTLLQRARVTDATMVGYLQPGFAAVLAALLLGEWPAAQVLAGGAVTLLGVWLATGRR